MLAKHSLLWWDMKEEKKVLERASCVWSQDSVRLILTPSNTARSVYLYAQETGYFKTAYPYFTERQNLDSFLLIYTLSGEGILEYEGGLYTMEKGDCMWIHCDNRHLYYTEEGKEWEFLWVHFNGNQALWYYKEFIKNGFRLIKERQDTYFEQTMGAILKHHQARDAATELQVSHLLNKMLTNLLCQTMPGGDNTFMMPEYIKSMLHEMDKDFRSSLPLLHFEQNYHRSRFHLLKEFKKYVGMTINEYIILARISYSKELLRYTDTSVEEIAYESGFGNVTHYINLFKAREGSTPLKYRKEWRK